MNRSEIMEPGMAALQDTLDAMAKDTPPVPESFRTAWRKAIRQEAAVQNERERITMETAQPETSRPEKDMQGNAGPRATRRKGYFSLQRGMSIAAAFVFLLGGALIGWDTVSLVRQGTEAPAVLNSMEDAEKADMEIYADEALEPALEADTAMEEFVDAEANDALVMALGVEPNAAMAPALESTSDTAMEESVDAEANDALVMAMGAEPNAAMETAVETDTAVEESVDAEANDALVMTKRAEPDATMKPAMEAAEDETAKMASEDIAAEAMETSPEQNLSTPESRPARTVGFILVGLAILLAAGALIFRKRERR